MSDQVLDRHWRLHAAHNTSGYPTEPPIVLTYASSNPGIQEFCRGIYRDFVKSTKSVGYVFGRTR